MPTFDVFLTRTYRVRMTAPDEERAREYAEYFTGHITDDSEASDRLRFKFQIEEIEMVLNDAVDVELVGEVSDQPDD